MAKLPGLALGFVLIVLLGAVTIPAAIDAKDDTVVESETIDIGETALFNSQIQIGVKDSSNTDVDLTVTDTETGETTDVTLPEGNTTEIDFSEGSFNITADVTTNQGSTLIVEYPSKYGYDPAVVLISDNLAIILVGMFFMAIMAFVGVKR